MRACEVRNISHYNYGSFLTDQNISEDTHEIPQSRSISLLARDTERRARCGKNKKDDKKKKTSHMQSLAHEQNRAATEDLPSNGQ